MKTEIKKITPEIARDLLKRNNMNRPLNKRHVENLKTQMLNNLWIFDGSPIKLDIRGRLLDGQHRLNAIIEANYSADFVVISGIPIEAFKVMDTGKTRTASDSIAIDIPVNSSMISDVSRSIITFDLCRRLIRGKGGYISNQEVYQFAMDNIFIINESYDFCKKFKRPIIPKSKLVTFHILFRRRSITNADTFISKLCTGLDLDVSSPVYILRQKLIADAISKKKIDTESKYALIAKCWNMYRKNETATTVHIPIDKEFEII